MRIDFEELAEFKDQVVEFKCGPSWYKAVRIEHMTVWDMNELRKAVEEDDRGQIQVIAYAVNINGGEITEEEVMRGMSKAMVDRVFGEIMRRAGESSPSSN